MLGLIPWRHAIGREIRPMALLSLHLPAPAPRLRRLSASANGRLGLASKSLPGEQGPPSIPPSTHVVECRVEAGGWKERREEGREKKSLTS